MTRSISTLANGDSIPTFPVRKFTVEEYRRLGNLGILSVDDQVELLNGWVVPKMNHNPPHDLALMLLEEQLRRNLDSNQILRIQMPITTTDSEPEPDLAVVAGPIRSYAHAHPSAEHAHLVVEIADTSLLLRDRQKCRIYASGGVQEYWIVNLNARQVEVYSLPSETDGVFAYKDQQNYSESDRLPLPFSPEAVIEVRDILS
jgi:Uma2 family endonuclease